jgi:hypothetical protein
MSDQSTLWGASLEFWNRRGVWLMIAGGVLGFVALVATVTSSFILWKVADLAQSDLEKKNLSHTKEIAELSMRAELLRKDTAEANKEAAEARLELQRLISWRMVSPEKFNAILEGVAPPANVEILYVPECSDCFMLAGMIGALLKDNNWPFSISELKKLQPPPDWMAGFPATLQHHANPTGVTVVSKIGGVDNKTAGALLRAIVDSIPSNGAGTGDSTLPDGVVRVVIAPKI